MARIGLARQIGFYLATGPTPPTLGELRHILCAGKDVAIGERLREARYRYKFQIEHFEVLNHAGPTTIVEHRYVMPIEARVGVREREDFKAWKAMQRRVA